MPLLHSRKSNLSVEYTRNLLVSDVRLAHRANQLFLLVVVMGVSLDIGILLKFTIMFALAIDGLTAFTVFRFFKTSKFVPIDIKDLSR